MAKGISISLATKCQLLFGLAVVVIIAGALAVPWQRMEQLAGQQNFKAARILADASFRSMHAGAGLHANPDLATIVPANATQPVAAAPTPAPATAPNTASAQSSTASAARLGWNSISILDTDYPRPRILLLSGPRGMLPAGDDYTSQALDFFRANEREEEWGTTSERGRIYHYAAAIRMERSCLQCHQGWVNWLAPRESTASTLPAAGAATAPATAPDAAAATTAASAPARLADSARPATWPLVAIVRVDLPGQTEDSQLLLNRIVIVVGGLLGGTLAIIVFYLITTRLILQPVRVLRNTAEKVAQGDLNIRSAISTGDEFQQLSEMFNKMLVTLKASQDQLESTNRSLDTRVGELAQSNVDLYEANRLKSEFLTNVSHELRTPLNAIIGFAELLAENPVSQDARIGRYVENVRTSAKQLLDLINDLLDLAKIEAGKLVLRQEKVSVADVCEAMVNFMRPLAGKKNIQLQLIVPETAPLPLISTDPGRFQQIIYNFMSNAVKFTPQDGTVKITAAYDEPHGQIRVSVSDTGPGIPAEFQQVIFEKFRQLDGSVTRQYSGSGLGLAISRELAHMIGGAVELTSAPGKGATFTLVVPVELPQRTVEVHTSLENS